jgi:NodT family efflux transporter outer membrane factor (OMF) lipoprotein
MRNLFFKKLVGVAVPMLLTASAAFAEVPAAPAFVPPRNFAWISSDEHADKADQAAFWRRFDDPELSQLVERALRENHDVRIAFARFESANALLRASKFDRLPTITAQANASKSKLSSDQASAIPGGERNAHSYDAGAVLSWELDLFGRVRNAVNAQASETQAASDDLRAMQVAIVSEVARDYFTLRGLQERLRVAQANEASQTDTLHIVEAGLEAGHGTEFDSARARAQLETTSSRAPALRAQISATIHHLAVLTGQIPEALDTELSSAQALRDLPPNVDPGTPGDVLLRRPDVAAAQARLASATARIGVARADLFPRFTLGGLLGTQAVHTDSLFEHGSETHLIALGIDWSFLDFGRVRARLAAAHANADGELAHYEQVVLRAIEETENALVRYDEARRQDEQLVRAAKDSADALHLARVRYDAGAIGFFEVLEAERSNLEAQDAAAQQRAQSYADLVSVYQALAGGWPAELPKTEHVGNASTKAETHILARAHPRLSDVKLVSS